MSDDRIFLACKDCKEKPALLAKEWGGWIGDTCEVWQLATEALEKFFKQDHPACSVSDFYLSDESGNPIDGVAEAEAGATPPPASRP